MAKKKRQNLKQRNPIAYDLLVSGLYSKKIERPKKGKGSYTRKGKREIVSP